MYGVSETLVSEQVFKKSSQVILCAGVLTRDCKTCVAGAQPTSAKHLEGSPAIYLH